MILRLTWVTSEVDQANEKCQRNPEPALKATKNRVKNKVHLEYLLHPSPISKNT